jgi:hypothetical protein
MLFQKFMGKIMRTSIPAQLANAFCLSMLMNIATAAEQGFTIQDVENCRSETVEFQNAAAEYFNESAKICSGGSRDRDQTSECLAEYQATVNEIKAQDSVAFFWKGNDSCEGSGYTCFGKGTLQYYSIEDSREELKAPLLGPMLVSENDGYPSLNSNKVDRCIYKSRLARVDNPKQPNGPQQAQNDDEEDKLASLNNQTSASGKTNATTPTTEKEFDSCQPALDAQEVEFAAINARDPKTQSIVMGIAIPAVVPGLQVSLYMTQERMNLLDRYCKGQPQYSQYQSTKNSHDETMKVCLKSTSDPSVCKPVLAW